MEQSKKRHNERAGSDERFGLMKEVGTEKDEDLQLSSTPKDHRSNGDVPVWTFRK